MPELMFLSLKMIMATKVDRSASSRYYALLITILVFVFVGTCCAEERSVYLVLMEEQPVAFHGSHLSHEGRKDMDFCMDSEVSKAHAKHLVDSHDQLLRSNLETGSYNKLYSFKHIVNGFSVHTTPSQLVEKDRGAKLMTTYTPKFLGLPQEVWAKEGGEKKAGEGIVIGFVDTGITPKHPSFTYDHLNPFTSNISHFSGACETGPRFPSSSCNGKIVSARYFSAGAQAIATLNTSMDFLSPFDAAGHGSHVASIAAGNDGVPVIVDGFYYGRASGMAPRARIAVYKAIYPTVGTITDVVAAIEQATVDGVDMLTLSVGPDEPPEDTITFLSVFDVFMLFARRAGVFVAQAAGNHGPDFSTVVSYSPWSVGVAACSTDRSYPGSLLLGNGLKVGGVGLSGPTFGDGKFLCKLVLAKDAVRVNGAFPRTPAYVEECQYPEALDPYSSRTLGFMGFAFVANPAYGDFIAEPIPFDVSGIMIPEVADAQIISQYYEQNIQRDERGFVTQYCAKAAIGEGRVASFVGQAPTVSRFSSRGPDFVDINRNPADVLKPDILAPGHQIWAAWSPHSALDPTLTGYHFALLSGTSMATPHIVGIAALIKQYNPSWTPSMIASAISTTAIKYDNYGELILAEGSNLNSYYPSTNFDRGAGLVNPDRAVDPGLILSSDFEDHMNFLCSLPGIDWSVINAATGERCNRSLSHPANLNLPSVTISTLRSSLTVKRSLKNVGSRPETYTCSVISPNGTVVNLSPTWFRIAPQETQDIVIQFRVIQAVGEFSFGEIVLTGSLNHIVRLPLSVLPISTS
ncbi:PROPROTEIN CONVERTASE SUBTILISIN/KEXIN [Salix viminalis]|uniref:PROPROTEIN CONVERTASE SUBTILISIN/KEXIN n=1 Tax=Salix viminalis TaxID=40686 RepID=A0A9Q0Z8J7_SALVM|nr:PROPROTEIN CONVERTASE SUBTILISIN/KEXIN [Salix viminalis]